MLPSIHRPFALRRMLRPLFATLMLAVLLLAALPTYAAERVNQLPFVNNFATARFKLLSTVEVEGIKGYSYGAGETVQPDRVSLWVGTDESLDLVYYVQIGGTVYQREGNGAWERTDDPAPVEALPVSAQFNELQQYANAILKIGSEPVNGRPTDHYQVWVSGERLLEAQGIDASLLGDDVGELLKRSTYKYDFWVSPQDGFLYQQNIEFSIPEGKFNGENIPAISSSSLVTYYDINDPTISVNAP